MASWRFRLFRRLAWGQMRKQTRLRKTEALPTTRHNLESLGMRARLPKNCTVESVAIDHVPAEWIVPKQVVDGRVLLYFHGGAYCLGSISTHRFLGGYLATAANAKLLLVDYRLAPEHPFPAAVDDGVAAYRFLLEQGVAPHKITVAGDSAGGGLTMAVLLALRDAGDPLPATAVCISPWVDLVGTGESMCTNKDIDVMLSPEFLSRYAQMYVNGDELTNPLVSPIYADLRGLPPLLIHVGTDEILLDDARQLAQRAEAAGVDVTLEIWPEMIHVWHALAMIVPESRQAIDRIGEFVKHGR